MRNQFWKPKKCELRHYLCTKKLSLQVIYANEVSIYDLQRCMICLNIIFCWPIQHFRSYYIGTKCTEQSHKDFTPTSFEQLRRLNIFIDVSFFGCDLSVVSLCENFAHLRSLVFTFISHSCSYCVEASHPLTLFVDFCLKDRFLRKKNWRNSHYWFYKTWFLIFRFTFLCELRLFCC